MAINKKGVISVFVAVGSIYLMGAGGFSLLGALATSALLGVVGGGLYEAIKNEGRGFRSYSSNYSSGNARYYEPHYTPSYTPPITINTQQPQPSFWGGYGRTFFPSSFSTSSVRQTGSTFVPASVHAAPSVVHSTPTASPVRQTGSTFVPASVHAAPSVVHSTPTATPVRQTGSTFVPAASHSSHSTNGSVRQTGSTFVPR